MKDSPSQGAIRLTVGAGPDEKVILVTPQFTRVRGAPMPGQPPESLEEWEDYKALTMSDLEALGFGNWNGSLALIPGEWFGRLPTGLRLTSISNESVIVGQNELSADVRYGCLAYGIMANNRE